MFRVGFALILPVAALCAAWPQDVGGREAIQGQSSPPTRPPAEPAFADIDAVGSAWVLDGADSSGAGADSTGADPPVVLDEQGAEVTAIEDGPSSWPESWPARGASVSTQYPTFNWSGFLQVDSGWFIQDDANVEAVGKIGDRTGLRRVRLRAYGNTRRTTAYVVDLDFAASGHPSFRDVALSFHEVPLLQNVYFGYFQQPFSLDAMTSGQELLFVERRLPFAFAPFRQTGLATSGTYLEDRVRWAVSVYRFPTDQYGRSIGSSGGYALASRVTCLPWYQAEGRRLLHLGFGYSYGDPGDNLVEYQIQPGFFVAETGGSAAEEGGNTGVPVFVDTGDIPTHSYSLFNAELGANLGPLHFQSEVTVSIVDQRGGPTTTFSGAYAQLGYYLTGESRPYDLREGVFKHARPLRDFRLRGDGHGAWEIAAGWSYIDLNDQNIQGGSMSEYSLQLNWYLNPLTKLMIAHTHSFLRDPEVGPSEAKIVGLRAQFRF